MKNFRPLSTGSPPPTAAPGIRNKPPKALLNTLLKKAMGLPGLAFLSPQDLTGALSPRAAASGASGARSVPLWGESTHGGDLPPAPLVFGALDAQWNREASFARSVARILQARRATGLAEGRLTQIFTGPQGCLATLSALPGGGYWLLATNFSDRKQRLACALPTQVEGSARDVLTDRTLPLTGHALELDLDARQARHVLLGGPKTHEGAMP